MLSIEQFIEQTNTAKSPEDVFECFQQALKAYGYDRICYSLITDHPSLTLKAGHGVMRNYPDDWMSYYIEKGYERLDPVPQYCFNSSMPFTWEFVSEYMDISKIQKKLMNQAGEALLLDGIAVPLHGANGELSGVGLASSAGNINLDKNTLMKIRSICAQFHLVYSDLVRKQDVINKVKLTNREREILLWASEGKSDSTISDILGISYSTVRFHLNNIYFKLGANERIFAVTKAIRLGIILPSYVDDTK